MTKKQNSLSSVDKKRISGTSWLSVGDIKRSLASLKITTLAEQSASKLALRSLNVIFYILKTRRKKKKWEFLWFFHLFIVHLPPKKVVI